MREKVCNVISQLHGIFCVFIFVPVIANIYMLFVTQAESAIFIYAGLSLIVPVLATYFASVKCKGLSAYLLISLASIAFTAIAAPRLADKIILVFIGLVVMIMRLVARMKEKEDILTTPAFGAVGLFVVAYVISAFSKYAPLMNISYYMTFLYIILYMIYLNFSNLESYMDINKDLAGVPKKQINRTNNTLLFIFLTITTVIMFILPMAGLDRGIASFGRLILKIIRMLAGKGSGDVAEDPIREDDGTSDVDMGSMPDFGTTPTPPWLTFLYEVMTYVMYAVVILVLGYLLVKAIINLFKAFYRPIVTEEGDVREFIKDDSKDERGSVFTSFRNRRPLFLNFTPEAMVRKAYIKRIEKQKKKIESEAFTPEEIEVFVELPETEENKHLHMLYEQARYSEHGVTKEEAKTV